jgi:transcriptional regulator GlxA family with amidase domain
MEIAVLLFEKFNVLDVAGPYEILTGVPASHITFVAAAPGLVHNDTGSLAIMAQLSLAEMTHPDVVVVPGGAGEVGVRNDSATLEWIRQVHRTTQWTTSVCTGSLILAASGILNGVRATTHWLAIEELRKLGAVAVKERVVEDGKVLTAAGVTAGIDMGLVLAARLAGDAVAQSIQLGMEYEPAPPFDAGSPTTAPREIVELKRQRSRFAPLLD